MKRNHVSSFFAPLQYDYEEDLYRLKDNCIGFGFVFQPLAGANDELGNQLANVFSAKGMPENTAVSFSIYSGDDVFRHLSYKREKLKKLSNDLPSDVKQVLKEAAEREIAHIQKATHAPFERQNETVIRNTVGWITFSIPVPEYKGRDKKRKQKFYEEFKERVLDLKQRFTSTLSQNKIAAESMNPMELLQITASIMNTGTNAKWRKHLHAYDNKTNIDRQICDYRTIVDRNNPSHLVIGDAEQPRYWKVLTQDRLPNTASLALSSIFLGNLDKPENYLPGNNIITCNMFFPSPDEFESDVRKQKLGAVIQRKFSEPHQKQAEDLEFIEKALADNVVPVKMMFTVAVSDKSATLVRDKAARAISHFSAIGYGLQEDDNILPALFFSMLPFGAATDPRTVDFFDRYKKMTSREAVRFLPMATQWKGYGAPMMSFVSRNGELMSYDFFSFKSYNGIIAAQTGMGKSVASNYVIQSYLLAGAKVWVIDLGDSYKNHCSIVGGNYYDFSDASQFNFDPFATIGEIPEKDQKDYVDMLTGVFGKMIVINEVLSDYQVSMLSKAIHETMKEHKKDASIPHVINKLKEHGSIDITRMGEQLEVFYTKYSEYFQGETRVDLTKGHFNVIELFNLKSKPHLAKVVLFQSIMAIERATFYSMRIPSEMNKMKIALLDESWQWIVGDSSSGGKTDKALEAFLTGAYRQFRKSNSGIWMVLQSIGDAYLNPNAQPILDNSANKLLLGQDNTTIDVLKTSGKMSLGSDYEYELLKSVNTVEGEFSEIFFMTDNARGIGRLSLDPYRFMMFSTKAEHKKRIEDYKQYGMTTDEAIRCAIGEITLQDWMAKKQVKNAEKGAAA